MTVVAINDPPDAVDDTAQTLADTAVDVAVLQNDADVEDSTLGIVAFTQPVNGEVNDRPNPADGGAV